MYCFSCYLALYLEKYLQYSIDITTEQSFKYIEFVDAKVWISKNASLCQVFANRVTFKMITTASIIIINSQNVKSEHLLALIITSVFQ